ncbi:MAG: GTPase ObgE [Candidatus Phytoplasma stylosanthis]|nr:GTPase ObgE [Candidatus Phytoplasma stylosanthis]
MNFIDKTVNFIKAGNGGNGIVSFRREKYVPYGGPSGGNGGEGGSVIFIGDAGINTLFQLQYQHKIEAHNGSNGKSKKRNGAKAKNLFVKVPLGTLVYNDENQQFIGEILEHKSTLLIAKGGKGGRGNYSLSNSKNKVPSYAEKGELGESLVIRTELKILADVGLVGFPNAGKSSLISSISNANSQVGPYPFTTIRPFLGTVNYKNFKFTISDIPGLIKDSHLGRGMGIRFLKHIERCKILIYVCSTDNEDVYESYIQLKEELRKYNSEILKKPQLILLNKMDLIGSLKKFVSFRNSLSEDIEIIPFSVLKKFNFNYLKYKIKLILDDYKENYKELNSYCSFDNYKLFNLEEEEKFNIYKDQQGYFVLEGKKIKKFFHKTDLNNYESLKKFSYLLKKMGVEEELRKKGMTNKDSVRIYDYIFELID